VTLTVLRHIGSLDRFPNVSQWWKKFEPNTADGRMNLNRDFQEFVELFVAHEVQFLVVGGYALADAADLPDHQ
jgi:hypothetical protein